MNRISFSRICSLLFGAWKKEFHHWFLVIGIVVVAILAYLKHVDSSGVESVAINIPKVFISAGSHPFSISLDYISNAQYTRFCTMTGYTTWRERYAVEPTWKHASVPLAKWGSEPVQHLNREDAQAFCYWIGTSNSLNLTPRLPTVDELLTARTDISFRDDQWEWTLQDMSAFEPNFPGAQRYLTTWNPSGLLRHRTTRDMNLPEEAPSAFHIVWD